MNILQVHNYYKIPGGEDTVVKNEKALLESHGHNVRQYTRSNAEISEGSVLQKALLPLIVIFNPVTYKDIRKIIAEQNIDIVHVHNTLALVSPAVYFAALSKKVPVIQTIHNYRMICPGANLYRDGHICEDCVTGGMKNAIQHSCYRHSRAQTVMIIISMWMIRASGILKKVNFICLTEFARRKLMESNLFNANRIYIKPNAVKIDINVNPYERREDKMIYVGRLEEIKGIDVLLLAWKELGNEAPYLEIYGTGPMEEWCKEYSSSNKLNVDFCGYVDHDTVIKEISESKALIFASRVYEGFPMTITEAFSVGTPVISSDIGNGGSMIIDGVNGMKFKNNSAKELSECVRRFMCNTIEGLSGNARKCAETLYGMDVNYGKLMNIYEKCIEMEEND